MQRQDWQWLDTAEGALAARNLALRAIGRGRELWPLLPEPGFRLPGAPVGTPTPLPPGMPLPPDLLPEPAASQPLLPLARFSGRLRRARLPAQDVDLALLTGEVSAPEGLARALARLTLEGPPAAALELAESLAADLALLPAVAGLDEAGLALARGEAPRPARRGAPVLADAEEARQALALAVAHLTEVLLVQAPLAHAGTTPDGVHQSRVAARRLRSCLKVFRPEIDGPELRRLGAALGDFARGLGAAREWDVFLGGLGQGLRRALQDPLGNTPEPRLEALLAAGQARREAAYAALRAMLEGPEFRSLIWQAMWLAATLPQQGPASPLRPMARAVMARAQRRILRRGRHFSDLPDVQLHELRLEAKRLRYAAELFAPLWPGRGARRYLKRLAALQEALGLANDGTTARSLVAALSGAAGAAGIDPWAIGLAEGWALAARGDMRSAAQKPWKRFRKTEPFWPQG